MKSTPLLSTYLCLASLLIFSTLSQAQGDRGGHGGNLQESDLKHFILQIDEYLQTEEGVRLFPEIVEYNRSHPELSFHQIAVELNPRLSDSDLFDQHGTKRDCISYLSPVRYFICSSKALNRTNSDDQQTTYYPSYYRLVFHELLVQAGLEKPLSAEVVSEYPIASRLNIHLETYKAWAPGTKALKRKLRPCRLERTQSYSGNPALIAKDMWAVLTIGKDCKTPPVHFKFEYELKGRDGETMAKKSFSAPLYQHRGDWVDPIAESLYNRAQVKANQTRDLLLAKAKKAGGPNFRYCADLEIENIDLDLQSWDDSGQFTMPSLK